MQHVPLLSETLRLLASNDLSAADYPYAAGSQVRVCLSVPVGPVGSWRCAGQGDANSVLCLAVAPLAHVDTRAVRGA
jgi:hypothetical protein